MQGPQAGGKFLERDQGSELKDGVFPDLSWAWCILEVWGDGVDERMALGVFGAAVFKREWTGKLSTYLSPLQSGHRPPATDRVGFSDGSRPVRSGGRGSTDQQDGITDTNPFSPVVTTGPITPPVIFHSLQ